MRLALCAIAVLAMSPGSVALAQNALPATNVTAPKPNPKPKVTVPTRAAPTRSDVDAAGLPTHPDPTSKVRAHDWNAPGVLDLGYMTDAQFATFQAAHPTATFFGRCYMGQDPDPNIRFNMRRIQFGTNCKG
jgi:hypothetical protein